MPKGPDNRVSFPITSADEIVELPELERGLIPLAMRPRVLATKPLREFRVWLKPEAVIDRPMPAIFTGMNRRHIVFEHRLNTRSKKN